jgi:hypothetical protein
MYVAQQKAKLKDKQTWETKTKDNRRRRQDDPFFFPSALDFEKRI